MLCVLFMQCISYRYILVPGNIVLSILADFYELNIWHAPASEIPVAIMTIPNARRAAAAAAAAAALLKAADCSSVRVIVLVADKRERESTDRYTIYDKNCCNHYKAASECYYAGFSLLLIVLHFIVTSSYCCSLLDIKGAKNKMGRLHH